MTKDKLRSPYRGDRPVATEIYFLLQQNQFSALHRIASDEIWHFYSGDPLVIYEIKSATAITEHLLGQDPEKGEQFQAVIPGGHWFGAKLAVSGEYALLGCTVSPGFDFEDFELAEKEKLIIQYPKHSALIQTLTL